MKRRQFIIGAGAVAASTSGCANIEGLISPNWPDVSPNDMSSFLTDFDLAMNNIAIAQSQSGLQHAFKPSMSQGADIRLFRQGMRSLLMLGSFRELSMDGQMHPGVQQRMQYSSPELISAVKGLTGKLASLSSNERSNLKRTLKEKPELTERVLESMDYEAAAVGIPIRRRIQMRKMGHFIMRQLKNAPDLFIDEYTTKSNKLLAQNLTDEATTKLMIAHMGKEGYKKKMQEAEAAMLRWNKMGVDTSSIGYELLLDPDEMALAQNDEDKASTNLYRKGLKSLGLGFKITLIGAAIMGLGALVESDVILGIGVVPGVTVGPIIIVVGLITLLIGGIADLAGD